MKGSGKFVNPGKGAFLATICVSALALPLFAEPVQVDTNAYAHTFCISFPGYGGATTLTNFPALVRLSAELNNFRYFECSVGGGDLRFADADGNLLASEIDTWNTNGESLVWVKVPEFNNETKIKAYYGCANPPAVTASDVWANGYVGVWHMNAASDSATQNDSTANPINVTKARQDNSVQDGSRPGVAGRIGAAAEFRLRSDGKGGYYANDPSGKLDGFESLTVEAWTNQRETYTNYTYLVSKRTGDGSGNAKRSYRLMTRKESSTLPFFTCYYYVTNVLEEIAHWPGSPNLASNTWYHQAHVYNGATGYKAWFLDGVSKSSSTTAQKVGTLNSLPKGDIFIGNWDDQWSTGAFPGKIDEVRISSVARSSDWLKASHDIVADEEFTSYEEANDWAKYAHRFAISFTNYTGTATLEDFPVLVRISEGAIVGFSYDDCLKPGGADLRFADENGALLDSEVEDWNPQGESLVWVKVPEFRNGTKLTGYYGWQFAPAANSRAVWSNGYVGVWHMDEDNSKTSLANSIWHGKPFKRTTAVDDGVPRAGNMTNGVDGVVGTAVKFNGDSAKGMYYIEDNTGKYDGFGAITVELWTWQDDRDPRDNAKQGYALRMYDGGQVESWSLYELHTTPKGSMTFVFDIDATPKYMGMPTDPERPAKAEWNHSAGVWDGTTGVRNMFLNGVNLTNHSGSDSYKGTMDRQTDVYSRLCLGNNWDGGANQYKGSIDEVRISNVARSADWIKATYDTVKSVGFASFGRARQNGTSGLFIMIR